MRRAEYWTFKRGLTTKIHLASASAEFALAFHLSPGNNHDAPEGRVLIGNIVSHDKHPLLMDRAYEDEATRQAALDSGFIPVVPPKKNRKSPWKYDKNCTNAEMKLKDIFAA